LAHVLRPLQDTFQPADYPALLVGLDAPDDAAIYRVNEQQAIIATVDFFPPVVDDPYAFGAIAAANALSDVYAMGGEVLFAINLAAFPENLDLGILSDILRGGADRVKAAGAVIAGGHTVKDKEPKYGLAVTGIVDPAKILTKGGARPGDKLYLTKPLGVGVITTALKRGQATQAHVDEAIASMALLNRGAAQAAQAVGVGVHAVTDVTGYSLLGHAHEMAHLSKTHGDVDFEIAFSSLPWLPGADRYAAEGCFPGGAATNMGYYRQWVRFAPSLDETAHLRLFDPQTSGGLLIAVAAEQAAALEAECAARGVSAWAIGGVSEGNGLLRVTR
jgi:selenide,water dikinase